MAQPENNSVFTDIRQLKTLVAEVSASLKSQRDILQKRGMNLPPGALQNIATIETDLGKLEEQILNDQTELTQLRTLAGAGSAMNSTLDLNTVLAQVMDEVILLTQAERGYIILRDEQAGELDFRIAREGDMSRLDGKNQISTTVLNEVLETGEALLADNAYKDPRMQDKVSIAQMVLRSVLCVPLRYKDKVTGAVYVDNRLRSGVFTDRERNLLIAFANQAAVAIENARLYARIQTALMEITNLNNLMDNVFSSIGSGVITFDEQNKVITYNPASAVLLGQEDLNGKTLREALMHLQGIDLDNAIDEMRATRRSLPLNASIESESRGEINIRLTLSPLAGEQTRGTSVVLDDITSQREREAKLETVSKYMSAAMVKNIQLISSLALGGERRKVTCMFVEVRGMNTLSHDLRPADIMHTMNDYLGIATDIILDSGGIIDKYMGTEIMVLFNTQLNEVDTPEKEGAHAMQAVECALTLRDAFLAFYAKMGLNPEPHFYRMGMNTGIATIGNVGSRQRKDFTAIGDNINLAKRLEENATRGQIIISEDTLKHIEHTQGTIPAHIRFDERDALQVKGRQQLTRVYEVFRA
ncbi:MAG: adenylate/guanylate cyclase domain-containing protein [Anaerolineae bacterium]